MRQLHAYVAALALGLAAWTPVAARPVTCAGGATLRPLLRAWSQAVAASGPAVLVAPDTILSAQGVRRLLDGRADCVAMVREPFPSELAAFRARFARPPLLVPVARGSYATRGGTHAIAIYVNAANPLRGLSLAQLRAAFGAKPGSASARTWGDLGLAGAWAARPLHVYGMIPRRASGDPPGIVNFLELRVLGGSGFRSDMSVIADRPGEQALAAIVREVAGDPDGLGYSGFGYSRAGARAVSIAGDEQGPFVAGTPRTVADGAYPLARRVYLLVDRRPGWPLSPPLSDFLHFVLSPRGQAMISADAEGFTPLTEPERRASEALIR